MGYSWTQQDVAGIAGYSGIQRDTIKIYSRARVEGCGVRVRGAAAGAEVGSQWQSGRRQAEAEDGLPAPWSLLTHKTRSARARRAQNPPQPQAGCATAGQGAACWVCEHRLAQRSERAQRAQSDRAQVREQSPRGPEPNPEHRAYTCSVRRPLDLRHAMKRARGWPPGRRCGCVAVAVGVGEAGVTVLRKR